MRRSLVKLSGLVKSADKVSKNDKYGHICSIQLKRSFGKNMGGTMKRHKRKSTILQLRLLDSKKWKEREIESEKEGEIDRNTQPHSYMLQLLIQYIVRKSLKLKQLFVLFKLVFLFVYFSICTTISLCL